eukprot:CAMPEP_0118685952 /NCGR_PEP_ID=MMETSP0800-20121206/7537_1 /TAXON_ID=210618 ORGANISM="Striatella unipunctata, Strain CCMP2910" /NCGR_SAMPLE_ID=MMETSP0800 /ASSEMBLY_ACC=CAM_ASM_000638 /LENGTH=300 /DNA_ID=CAMNT_0006582931 /DNA_START=108 /DNA_END=1007 /DNA_ORIENTATION=-
MCLSDDHAKKMKRAQASASRLKSLTKYTPSYKSVLQPGKLVDLPLSYLVPIIVLMPIAMLRFSLWFPHILAPHAAKSTYLTAFYHYEMESLHFDNTVWTWGSDYFLAVVMGSLAVACLCATKGKNPRASLPLRLCSAGLLLCYTVSVLVGGVGHQFYTSFEFFNTLSFRLLWTVCVGTVTLAGGFMGACSTLLARGFSPRSSYYIQIPFMPEWGWTFFGIYLTASCAEGRLSFQRPACDIFIAGTTQLLPTIYCIIVMWLRKWDSDDFVSTKYRVLFVIGLVLNAPLLPMYPLLVQYTDW